MGMISTVGATPSNAESGVFALLAFLADKKGCEARMKEISDAESELEKSIALSKRVFEDAHEQSILADNKTNTCLVAMDKLDKQREEMDRDRAGMQIERDALEQQKLDQEVFLNASLASHSTVVEKLKQEVEELEFRKTETAGSLEKLQTALDELRANIAKV